MRPSHRLHSLGEEVVAGEGALELPSLWVALPGRQHHQHSPCIHQSWSWSTPCSETCGSTASWPPDMVQCRWREPPSGTSGTPSRCCTRTFVGNVLSCCHGHRLGKPHHHLVVCQFHTIMIAIILNLLHYGYHHHHHRFHDHENHNLAWSLLRNCMWSASSSTVGNSAPSSISNRLTEG